MRRYFMYYDEAEERPDGEWVRAEDALALAAVIARVRAVPAWSPCPAEPDEDDDGPLYQGFVTDPEGTWVKVEDLVTALAAAPEHTGRAKFTSKPGLSERDVLARSAAEYAQIIVELDARVAELEVAERLARATANSREEALRQTDVALAAANARADAAEHTGPGMRAEEPPDTCSHCGLGIHDPDHHRIHQAGWYCNGAPANARVAELRDKLDSSCEEWAKKFAAANARVAELEHMAKGDREALWRVIDARDAANARADAAERELLALQNDANARERGLENEAAALRAEVKAKCVVIAELNEANASLSAENARSNRLCRALLGEIE